VRSISYQESTSSKRANIGSEIPEYSATSVPTNPHKRTPNVAFAYQVSLRQRFCQGNCSVTSNHSFDTVALNRFLDPKRVFHPRVKALTAYNCTTLQGCVDGLLRRRPAIQRTRD
jgi:hypothetical protein